MLMMVLFGPMGKRMWKWSPSCLQILQYDWVDKLREMDWVTAPTKETQNPAKDFQWQCRRERCQWTWPCRCHIILCSPRKSDGMDFCVLWEVGSQGYQHHGICLGNRGFSELHWCSDFLIIMKLVLSEGSRRPHRTHKHYLCLTQEA